MTKFECNGFWWTPGSEEAKVAGVLLWSPEEGLRLQLTGTLSESTKMLQPEHYPLILGLVSECPLGNLVTLTGCDQRAVSFSSPGFTREELYAQRAYFGSHLIHEGDFKFKRCHLRLSYLSDWVQEHGIKLAHGEKDSSGRLLELHYNYPAELHANTPSADLILSYAMNLSREGRRRVTVHETVFFEIAAKTAATADELNREYVYPLQNLLTLATDRPNAVVEFALIPDERDQQHQYPTQLIHVLGRRVFNLMQDGEKLFPHNMLFTSADVSDRFEEVVSQWLQVFETLRPACDAFFAYQYKPPEYLEAKFLMLLQALLTYCNQRYEQRVEARQSLFSDITSSASPEERVLLEAALSEFTRSDVRQAIEWLLEDDTPVLSILLGPDPRDFIERVAATRNFIVHRLPAVAASKVDRPGLFWINERLLYLLKFCFVRELGLPTEKRLELLKRNEAVGHLLRATKPEVSP